MGRRIVIIQGHPDSSQDHFGHALAAEYAQGAEQAGHQVKQVKVAELEFPLVRSKEEFDSAEPPPSIREAQGAIAWANHLVIVYPLWLGGMPALLKGFFEQTLRPGFAADPGAGGGMWKKRLKGRSARIVVTMGMPALVYRFFFGAHGLKSLARNVLGFAGVGPVRSTLIGTVDALDASKREVWLSRLRALGRQGN
jgi:putative NADPH-quinone reductase